jgi:hypothetical protein
LPAATANTPSPVRTDAPHAAAAPPAVADEPATRTGELLSDAKSLLGDAKSSLGVDTSSLGDAKSSLGVDTSSLGDAKSSLGDAKSSLGNATSSLGDAKSPLGDAKSSLGGAKSSLLRARWVTRRETVSRRVSHYVSLTAYLTVSLTVSVSRGCTCYTAAPPLNPLSPNACSSHLAQLLRPSTPCLLTRVRLTWRSGGADPRRAECVLRARATLHRGRHARRGSPPQCICRALGDQVRAQ